MEQRVEDASSPNVVVLVFDTARAWNFSCYGHSRRTTPVVDKLAGEGTLYENATSVSPWTLPSHASLFTGVPPAVHRTNSLNSRLPQSLVTLAESLSSLGYDTVGMSSNPWFSSQFGITRGFDEFHHLTIPFGGDSYRQFVNLVADGSRSVPERIRSLLTEQDPGTILRNCLNAAHRQLVDLPDDGAERAVDRAEDVIKREEPYFLFINFLEPHLPYEPPDDYEMTFMPEKTSPERVSEVNQNARDYNVRNVEMTAEDFRILERLYDAEINYVDDQIGRLLDYIDENGDREETILIVLGDHGENIGDHGLMSHNYSIHETLLHVPLIVRYPPVFEAGKRVETRVSTLDVPATVRSLLGSGTDGRFQSQQTGRSLRHPDRDRSIVAEYLNPVPPISRMEARCENSDFDVSVYDRTLRAIYQGENKLIRGSDGSRRLYNVVDDPAEKTDTLDKREQVASQLDSKLTEVVERYNGLSVAPTETEATQEIEGRLESLGYL